MTVPVEDLEVTARTLQRIATELGPADPDAASAVEGARVTLVYAGVHGAEAWERVDAAAEEGMIEHGA